MVKVLTLVVVIYINAKFYDPTSPNLKFNSRRQKTNPKPG